MLIETFSMQNAGKFMFALDTNLLVYAHNADSPLHAQAKAFLEMVLNERDERGHLGVCLPAQVLMEFVNVMSRQNVVNPLSFATVLQIAQDYLDTGILILNHRDTQLTTFLSLCRRVTSRKKVFDLALVATLQDHGISGLYTVNVRDFAEFEFLQEVNPLD